MRKPSPGNKVIRIESKDSRKAVPAMTTARSLFMPGIAFGAEIALVLSPSAESRTWAITHARVIAGWPVLGRSGDTPLKRISSLHVISQFYSHARSTRIPTIRPYPPQSFIHGARVSSVFVVRHLASAHLALLTRPKPPPINGAPHEKVPRAEPGHPASLSDPKASSTPMP